MKLRKRFAMGVAVSTVAVSSIMGAGVAMAAFPDLSDCPRTTDGVTHCLDLQSTGGNLTAGSLNVALGNAIEIRGGLTGTRPATLVPPTGTNGFFATPIPVPGGLSGYSLPTPADHLTVTPELAGDPSLVAFSAPGTLALSFPLKLKLTNPLLGSTCHIGTDSDPISVSLTLGTTSPPPPNQPISGQLGSITFLPDYRLVEGNVHVDNAFAVPGASGCGDARGIVDRLLDRRFALPSAAGQNTFVLDDDFVFGNV